MKNNLPEIPIFFACDDSYLPFLAVTLESLEENASKEYKYLLKILHTNTISLENQKRIYNEYNKDNYEIEFVDISKTVNYIFSELHTRDYYSKTTYYRLFIPNLYPKFDKAIYLDSDIVVKGDISELYNIDISNYYLGAARENVMQTREEFKNYVQNRIGVKDSKNYFNAGILLMNLKVLREINLENIFINLLKRVTFTITQDEDYLNAICNNHTLLLSSSWNASPIPGMEIPDEDLKIIHYLLTYKPWHIDNVNYENYFWHYAKKTSYYKEIKTIKDNYDLALQIKSEDETKRLIELAKIQASEHEENKRISTILKEYCDC